MDAAAEVTADDDVEAGVRPPRADKAVSTGDLGAPLGDLLAALVQSKASAIRAECEREDERGRRRAWHWLHRRAEPQARVTPVVHHHAHHHHPLHHHHHHHHRRHHQQQPPPLTLHGSPLSPADGASPWSPPGLAVGVPLGGSPPGRGSPCSSDACTPPAPQGPQDPQDPQGPQDATVTGMCTTSDAPGLPSDTTQPNDSDSDPGALPPLPLDPPPSRPSPRPRGAAPPLRRTLSSRSHQYHNYDYSATRATSLSCSATPLATPAATPLGTPAPSAAPSRAASPPTPPSPENHLHLLYHPYCAQPPDVAATGRTAQPQPRRPHRKKRRRRHKEGDAGAAGGGRRKARKQGVVRRGPLPPEVQTRQLDPDDLPKRARWTIAVTACFLLALSMLLVGITLRMAPIIDDMVRKQNEEHENLLKRAHGAHATRAANETLHGHRAGRNRDS